MKKLIVWLCDEFQFVRDGETDVHTLLPNRAKKFNTSDEAESFMSTHFPCTAYIILGIDDWSETWT